MPPLRLACAPASRRIAVRLAALASTGPPAPLRRPEGCVHGKQLPVSSRQAAATPRPAPASSARLETGAGRSSSSASSSAQPPPPQRSIRVKQTPPPRRKKPPRALAGNRLSEHQLALIPLARLFKGALATRFRPTRAQLATMRRPLRTVEQLYNLAQRFPDGGVAGASSFTADELLLELSKRGIQEREFIAWCVSLSAETYEELHHTMDGGGARMWPTFLIKRGIELARTPAHVAQLKPVVDLALAAGSGSVVGSTHLIRLACEKWLRQRQWVQFAPWVTSLATRLARLTLMQRDHLPIALGPSEGSLEGAAALFGKAIVPAGDELRANMSKPDGTPRFAASHTAQPQKFISRPERETWQWHWQPVMQARQVLMHVRETLLALPEPGPALDHLETFLNQHAGLGGEDLTVSTRELARLLTLARTPLPDLEWAAQVGREDREAVEGVVQDILFAVQDYLASPAAREVALAQNVVQRAMELCQNIGSHDGALSLWILLQEKSIPPSLDVLAHAATSLIKLKQWDDARELMETHLRPVGGGDGIQGTSLLLKRTLEALLRRHPAEAFLWFDEAIVRYSIRPDATCLDLILRGACRASYPFPPRTAAQEVVQSDWSDALARAVVPWLTPEQSKTLLRHRVGWHALPPLAMAAMMFRTALLGQVPKLAELPPPLVGAWKSPPGPSRWFSTSIADALLPCHTWDVPCESEKHAPPAAPKGKGETSEVVSAFWTRWRHLGARQALYFDARLCEAYALAVYQLSVCMTHVGPVLAGAQSDEIVTLLGWMRHLSLRPTRLTLALAVLDAERARTHTALRGWIAAWLGPDAVPSERETEYVRRVWREEKAAAEDKPDMIEETHY